MYPLRLVPPPPPTHTHTHRPMVWAFQISGTFTGTWQVIKAEDLADALEDDTGSTSNRFRSTIIFI